MYLKRLELQGFKSFADKTILEFMPGITTVIGPNGSGKSNISDAIRWVLGEQSMKSLRGSKSEDIIFAGTQNRKSLGFAEASIVFDNTDGRLPIEYSEVTVTRKIYRSGETGYYINKTPCRLKDILELFMDTGIGKDGYSIIGQGKIDEILSNKSEDRRHIFEEAAGIVKYRVRKAESEKKLEQTKLNLLRINDILTEIESNLEPLKNQSEKAKKFLDLREELKSIEVGLFLYNIETYKEKLEQIVKDSQIIHSQYEDEQKKQQEIVSLKERLKAEIDSLTSEIEGVQNLSFESSKQKEQIHSDINVAKERISNNKDNSMRYQNEMEQVKLRITELEEEKQQKISKKENLSVNKEKFVKELAEKEESLRQLTEKLSQKELEIEAKKKTVSDNTDKRYELVADINTKEANYENLQKRKKVVSSELESTISELDETRLLKSDISQEFSKIEAKRNEISKSLEVIHGKKENGEIRLKDYDNKIQSLEAEFRMKQSRYNFLVETEKEKEGYIRSVKSILLEAEKNKNGVHGVLANIITAPKEYETAIEMCLGQALQNIVTDTEEDAKKQVEYLRNNNLGRASFLPISAVRGKKIERLIKNGLDGVVGIAADLIKFDKKYEQIILNLLGRTVIVDDMNTAISLAKQNGYSFKIVTLKGDVINPSGSITGGSVTTKTVNILGRSREIESLEKELKKLTSKIEDVKKQKEEYASSIEDILEEAISLEKVMQETDITYATQKQRVASIEENIAKLEQRKNKLKEELENIELSKRKELEHKLKNQEEIQKIEEENQSLNQEIETYALANKDNQKYIDDLNFDITNLKISCSSFDESESSLDEILARIKTDIENNKKSIENKEKEIESITKDNENLEQYILTLLEEIKAIDEKVASSGTRVQELKELRIQKNESLAKTEEEIQSKFKVLEDLKEQSIKIDVKKTKMEQDLEEVVNKLWEEYELTPNSVENYNRPSNIASAQKQVNSLRNQIRDLGSINIDSIEEYKQTKERYDFMCEQRLDLENTMAKLRKIISDITITMKEQFKEKFEIINQNFDEVFKELFGGGKAELVLEDEENILECGIDIHVQPTGKKLQNMMLLSGGEKAFTAIALLFAILKINPAPFCVLDEIEAALDDVNVYRFADYLKKFAKETQFLVITHRKGTMEAADTVYGITMEENGISKLLSMKMK